MEKIERDAPLSTIANLKKLNVMNDKVASLYGLIEEYPHNSEYSFDLNDGSTLHADLENRLLTFTPSLPLQLNVLQAFLGLKSTTETAENAKVMCKELFTKIRVEIKDYDPETIINANLDGTVYKFVIYVDENRVLGISPTHFQIATLELVLKTITEGVH